MWRWGTSLGALGLALACTGAATAQTLPATPPVHPAVDAQGVDLITGAFTPTDPQLTVGPAGRSLTRDYLALYGAAADNLVGLVGYTGGNYATVSIGGASQVFVGGTGSWTPSIPDGSSLSYSASTYQWTYTLRDGTVAIFSDELVTGGVVQANGARLTSLTHPNGETDTFTWNQVTFYPGGNSEPSETLIRLQSVTNNYGEQLKYQYASDTTQAGVLQLVSITGINNAVDYCSPTASTCSGFSQSWPAVTYNSSGGATDPTGQRTTTYSGSNAASTMSIKRPSGLTWTATLQNGQVTSVTNGLGTWNYAFSTSGTTQTTTVTDPNGNTRTVVSNTALDVITSDTDGLNRTIAYGYDAYGRLTSVTYPLGEGVSYTYDGRGNVTQTTYTPRPGSGQSSYTTSATYDTACTYPVKCNKPNTTTDANGNTTAYGYSSVTGLLTDVKKPALPSGVRPETVYSYTSMAANVQSGSGGTTSGNPIYLLTQMTTCNTTASCSGTADQSVTTIAYDANHNLAPVTVTTAAGDGSVSSTQKLSYDVFGNLATSTGPLNGVSTYFYDADRERIGTAGPDPDGSGPLTPTAARVTYNSDGVVTETEQGTVPSADTGSWANFNANFSSTTQLGLVRDGLDRLTSLWTNGGGVITGQTQYTYDHANRLLCTAVRMNPLAFGSQSDACTQSTAGTDGPDRITRLTYDAANEVIQRNDGYGTSSDRVEKLTYADVPGANLPASVTDANGNVTNYGDDGFDRLVNTWYASPSTGKENTSDYETLGYDANGNVISRRLRDGTTLNFAYDALNDMTTGGDGATYTYDTQGRRLTGSYGGSTTTLTYDALGRQTSQTNPWGTLHYSYDAAGDRTALKWPDGFYVKYVYDVTGRMTAVEEQGATSGVGLLASYGYDSLGRRASAAFAGGASTLGASYGYDTVSRLSQVSYAFGGAAGDNDYIGLNYNAANGLKVRTHTNGLYDWSGGSSVQQDYAVNHLNQITSAGSSPTYSYDARGNLTSDGTNAYGYDALNRLTTANGEALSYDAFGRLACTTGGGTQTCYLYDGSDLIAEYDGNGNLLRRYVFGSGTDDPIVWYEGSNTSSRNWLMKDQQGSIMAVANGSGQVSATNTYDPYGLPGSANSGRFQYTGQAFIPEVGLYNYKARFYSPTLGRFLQTDPIGYGDGMNWYAYAHGDPVNGTDPTGTACSANAATNTNCQTTASDPGPSPPTSYMDWIPVTGYLSPFQIEQKSLIQQLNMPYQNTVFTNDPLGQIQGKLPQSTTVSEVVVTAKRLARRAVPFAVDLDPLLDALWWIFTPTPTAANDTLCGGAGQASCVFSRPQGAWPADKGAAEWGKRNGMNGKEGTRIFHGIKQGNGGAGKDDYSVDPSTGDVYDQNGDYVGNLHDGP